MVDAREDDEGAVGQRLGDLAGAPETNASSDPAITSVGARTCASSGRWSIVPAISLVEVPQRIGVVAGARQRVEHGRRVDAGRGEEHALPPVEVGQLLVVRIAALLARCSASMASAK